MRLALPPPIPERQAVAFPWMGALAPVLAAGVLFAITRSPLSLAFAALGPIMAIAGLVDGRLGARRAVRAATRQRAEALALLSVDVAREHALIRGRRAAASPTARELLVLEALPPARTDGPLPVRLGTGPVPSGIDLDASSPDDRAFVAHASRIVDAPVVVDARGGVGLIGQPALTEALARSLEVQLLWLGHGRGRRGAESLIRRGDSRAELAPSCDTLVQVAGPGRAQLLLGDGDEFTPELLTGVEAQQFRRRSAFVDSEPPGMVRLTELLACDVDGNDQGLSAVFAATSEGPFSIDLVADGPHALIAGTTGSGKSEMLIAWMLSLARTHSTDELGMLLFDFKGGSSFDSLADLPHVQGIVTDLDGAEIWRSTAALAAEMKRREAWLRERGARSVDSVAGLPRLVIVVDEFAVLVESGEGMHSLFADIAARGRSLGIHLILCTQRPSGIMRDSLLANFGLRISLRVVDGGDSRAIVGTEAAAQISRTTPGRCWIALHGDPAVEAQVAFVDAHDSETLISLARRGKLPQTPAGWLAPLPSRIDLGSLRHRFAAGAPAQRSGEVLFGVADRPAEGIQPPAVWNPARDGGLAIIGAAGSGRSTAAITIARQLEVPVLDGRDPLAPEALWDAVRSDATEPLVIDDIEAALDGLSDEHAAEIADAFGAMLRRRGRAVAVTLSSPVAPAARSLASALASTLVLRTASRDDHVMSGAPAPLFESGLRSGAGVWRGDRVQVAISGSGAADGRIPLPVITDPFTPGSVFGVISTTPAERLSALATIRSIRAVDVRGLDSEHISALLVPDTEVATALIADPETWQRSSTLWSLTSRLACVYDGCSVSQFRLVSGRRELPPALAPIGSRLWVAEPEKPVRRGSLPEQLGKASR